MYLSIRQNYRDPIIVELVNLDWVNASGCAGGVISVIGGTSSDDGKFKSIHWEEKRSVIHQQLLSHWSMME